LNKDKVEREVTEPSADVEVASEGGPDRADENRRSLAERGNALIPAHSPLKITKKLSSDFEIID
jgi:hypothetical protein